MVNTRKGKNKNSRTGKKPIKERDPTRKRDPHIVYLVDQVKYMAELETRSGHNLSMCYRNAIDWFIASFGNDFLTEYKGPRLPKRLAELNVNHLRNVLGRQFDRPIPQKVNSSTRRARRQPRSRRK